MQVLETRHKRKSAVITTVIMLLLVVAIFNFGMRYLDPPAEYGIAINYGTSNVGKGEPEVIKKVKAEPKQTEESLPEETKEVTKEAIEEEVVTQEEKEAPVMEKPKEKKKEIPKEEVKEEKPKETPKPKKPSKATQDALNNLLKGATSDGKQKGEGGNAISGLKGKKTGDPNTSKYYGNTGSDGDSNYNLAGRRATSKPIQKPDCEEEGIVVVSIEVDKSGRVIKAIPGVKGTTNSANCLLKPAKEAALKTKWNADGNAPAKQRGTIIYKFSLTK
ncbi:MAG: energy transducer TonB [Flavobacteriaceae bacterium]|nr:MAG: energy transducer TonB [Flavobacteriaceae bacterium]